MNEEFFSRHGSNRRDGNSEEESEKKNVNQNFKVDV